MKYLIKFIPLYFCGLAHIAGLIVGLATMVTAIETEMHDYRAEGKCIAKHISHGVERRDIKTMNGICWVDK